MNQILWRKWEDPLLPMVKGKMPKSYSPEEDEHDAEYHAAIDTFRDEGEQQGPRLFADDNGRGNTGPCIVGPFGIVPMFESNLPSALFNFWMGDTNFGLDEDTVKKMEMVEGVEAIDVYTRYRFRIAVGRAFDQHKVKAAIETLVRGVDEQKSTPPTIPLSVPDPLDKLKKILAKAHKHWAIVVLSANRYQGLGGDTREEVLGKAKKYDGAAEKVVLSWEI